MPGFSNYKIQAELGRGGMGIVYKAVDLRENKTVAIKQLILENVDPEKHEEFTERFRREAKTASMLKHENIVNVLDISEEGSEKLFYVMEYLVGRSLREELAQHKSGMSAHKYWSILKQVADGLSYAH